MLQLKNITKEYNAGGGSVKALRGIDLEFRENEFVSVLGPSGCGKTTLLNIVGGLDRYTSGDLVINGKSTKSFKSSDWDTYRNHSIGFVFQNYNLIPHQSVLSNVELALTLSGVSKSERRERAIKVLQQVGLGDQLNKKPNQMSGGQMQRVAIARALINDPDILLADEPTGALDSETSVQIMELLKSISSNKLVIMVTHNPELADKYSTRIVRLLDGNVIDDSNPYKAESDTSTHKSPVKKTTMSFFTAMSLSLNNLMTKKARTFLTAFAGSIGIIGIALILSLSNGLQSYITRVEEDTLSSYPITIEHETIDVSSLAESFMGSANNYEVHERDKVYTSTIMTEMLNTMISQIETNDLRSFKEYIEQNDEKIAPLITTISYGYDTDLILYYDSKDGPIQVNPSLVFEKMGMSDSMTSMASFSPMMQNTDMWTELLDNHEFLETQYDVIAGRWPEAFDEVVLIVDSNNEISDMALYSLGLKNTDEIPGLMTDVINGNTITSDISIYSYDEILSLEYSLVLPTDYYKQDGNKWLDMSNDEEFIKQLTDSAPKIKIVGIIRGSEEAIATSANGTVGYTSALTHYIVDGVNEAEITKAQLADDQTDVFTGLPFDIGEENAALTMDEIMNYVSGLPQEEQEEFNTTIMQMSASGMTDEQITEMLTRAFASESDHATYDGNLEKLGISNLQEPSTINIYASSFDNKESLAKFIDEYNTQADDKITYTDYVGLMMSSITTVINAISYLLIAFVSISLIVSSIMIGIITYISVLERTKEIGILRSIGASKRDISRVFNAETLIVGFVAGALGIIVTLLLCIPANAIINSLTGISGIAALPPIGAVILILISMLLTFIAGLIPSRIAAKKDPVVALRTE